MKHLLTILSLFVLIGGTTLSAQETLHPVDSLCDALFKASNRYMANDIEYRVIKRYSMDRYLKEIKAVDKAKSTRIDAYEKQIQALNQQIVAMDAEHAALSADYEAVLKVKNDIEFLTLNIPKKRYNVLVWGLIFILIAAILVLLLMFKTCLSTTRSAKADLEEKTEEFEAFRRRALKREQEVASGYMREISKLKDKLGMR